MLLRARGSSFFIVKAIRIQGGYKNFFIRNGNWLTIRHASIYSLQTLEGKLVFQNLGDA